MSERVDMVEVETEANESDELFSVCKNTINVDNHSENDIAKSKSENHTSIHIKIVSNKVIFYKILDQYSKS